LQEISKYSIEQVTAYVFVIDAINFCFWPNNPEGAYEYEHMANNLATILDDDPEFFTPARLAAVTEQEIRQRIYNSLEEFALVDERARLIREVGQIMVEKELTFEAFVRANLDCQDLVKAIIDNLPGFRDHAEYMGRTIFFYKRAQILVADLCGAYKDYKAAKFDADVPKLTEQINLTMFPDYRVPQILRHRGIFEYSAELAQAIDS